MKQERNNILENIIKIREIKGFSQEYVAEKIGIKQSGFGLIERGERKLDYEKLAQIALIFEMDIIDIITFPNKYILEKSNDCPKCNEKDLIISNLNDYINILKTKINGRKIRKEI